MNRLSIFSILKWVAIATRSLPVLAAPTWPSSIDELEDIMLLNTGYRSRGFPAPITPCGFSANGPGRMQSAEWLRTAFHDMATGSVYTGVGGLDASIMFELNDGENEGQGFLTSLQAYAPYLSSRASMADLIALGVYASVRVCGGPVIPIRTGRVDATAAGPQGVPQPQNAIGIFQNQFLRVGFNTSEMITVVACGHTLGGVHASNFPTIVPAGSATNDFAKFDNTDAFDNTVATSFVSGTTKDPLVVGPSVSNGRNSDGRVFAADGNVTIKAMMDPTYFSNRCQTMLQRMIEVVPSGTTLTDPITPYEVKPYALQLTLQDGGNSISFTGDIRIRTTSRPSSQIGSVQLVYSDRTGAQSANNIQTSYKNTASGFDDSFTFFSFSTQLSANTSISSFKVLVTLTSGSTQLYDNNGNGFPISDAIMLQMPQSCVDSSGKLTVVAAVRDTSPTPSLNVIAKVPRANGIPVPALSTVSAAMATQSSVGSYMLYSATYTPSNGNISSFGISAGSASDNYKDVSLLPSACSTLNPTGPTSTPTPSTVAYQGCYTDSVGSRALTGATYFGGSEMSVEKCSSLCSIYAYFGVEYGGECYCGNSISSSSSLAAASDCSMPCTGNSAEVCGAGNRLSLYKNNLYAPIVHPNITGYTYQGCYSEASSGRALTGSSTSADDMTVESCAGFCAGTSWFGVEYGRECYCGNALANSSSVQPATDCSFTCSGDGHEYCGAGNRLDLYKKT